MKKNSQYNGEIDFSGLKKMDRSPEQKLRTFKRLQGKDKKKKVAFSSHYLAIGAAAVILFLLSVPVIWDSISGDSQTSLHETDGSVNDREQGESSLQVAPQQTVIDDDENSYLQLFWYVDPNSKFVGTSNLDRSQQSVGELLSQLESARIEEADLIFQLEMDYFRNETMREGNNFYLMMNGFSKSPSDITTFYFLDEQEEIYFEIDKGNRNDIYKVNSDETEVIYEIVRSVLSEAMERNRTADKNLLEACGWDKTREYHMEVQKVHNIPCIKPIFENSTISVFQHDRAIFYDEVIYTDGISFNGTMEMALNIIISNDINPYRNSRTILEPMKETEDYRISKNISPHMEGKIELVVIGKTEDGLDYRISIYDSRGDYTSDELADMLETKVIPDL
ncbi:hypothetical protein [Evansella tamaricis]|uniref:Uncharacterized protein n=1 Tax=Evansella tamaricis TaxID=2069301 RepID=A0ABS6JIK8_9BACI|nr:hypothetical protein [Evansella tamaricis]MBU9713473.1 hypothetical protein [Evansella tamaricis]